MSDLPPPLVPADVDLRDFAFMPIDIVRLLGSDFHAQSSDAEWRAGVTLWLRSYHQVPAGSLPDDEVALARLAELGRDVKSWRKISIGALRGWTTCSDGRLYHRTVGEKVLEGWIEKLLQRKSSAAGNAKRYGHPFDPATFDDAIEESRALLHALNPQSRVLAKRFAKAPSGSPDQPPTGSADGNPSGTANDIPHRSQETGTGKGRDISVSLRSAESRAARDAFDRDFWPKYPHKVGKPAAAKAFEKVWRDAGGDIGPIVSGLERYIRDKPADRPWLNPATFLNQRRFDDEPAASTANPHPSTSSSPRIDFGGGISWPEATVLGAVARYRTDPASWPADRIGPPPGAPGCRVPEHLLREAA